MFCENAASGFAYCASAPQAGHLVERGGMLARHFAQVVRRARARDGRAGLPSFVRARLYRIRWKMASGLDDSASPAASRNSGIEHGGVKSNTIVSQIRTSSDE